MLTQTPIDRAPEPAWLLPVFDADGFLIDSDRWNRELAQELASQGGIDCLSAKHWQVISIVREGYFSMGALPVMRLVCRAASLDPSHAHELFSSCTSLWRIAGLPNPGEEARAYMQ